MSDIHGGCRSRWRDLSSSPGGVVSSLGKGLASAALGALLAGIAGLLQSACANWTPILTLTPARCRPFEHGEVFVTDDGAETDLDLGHYERFTGVAARSTDSAYQFRADLFDRSGKRSAGAITWAKPSRSSPT